MEFDVNVILELKKAWKTLCSDIEKTKKIKFEMFESAFSGTYALLSKHLNEASLDKQLVHLIADAFLFASVKDNSLESVALAATVLTERMLNSVAFNCSADTVERSSVYLLESHEEIMLDFSNINESIAELTKAFDNAWWKKLAK